MRKDCELHDLTYIYVRKLNELITNERKQMKKHYKKVDKVLNVVHAERRQKVET